MRKRYKAILSYGLAGEKQMRKFEEKWTDAMDAWALDAITLEDE